MSGGDESACALSFFADATDFLEAADGFLAADPVVSTVVTTIAHRPVAAPDDLELVTAWFTAVAEVSARLLTEGARVCLFTDQANPTSNKIYVAMGYRPVVDMANLVIAS